MRYEPINSDFFKINRKITMNELIPYFRHLLPWQRSIFFLLTVLSSFLNSSQFMPATNSSILSIASKISFYKQLIISLHTWTASFRIPSFNSSLIAGFLTKSTFLPRSLLKYLIKITAYFILYFVPLKCVPKNFSLHQWQ